MRLLSRQLGVPGLEGIGDVLQEDQAEDDVLVFGRVHVVAQGIGGGPELGFETEVGAVFFLRWFFELTASRHQDYLFV